VKSPAQMPVSRVTEDESHAPLTSGASLD
jgi:hypothetical protein